MPKGGAIDPVHRLGRCRGLPLCGFAAALVGAAALLDHLSLGYDELFSIYFARQPLSVLLGTGWHAETNPPLYFLLLHGWIALFGDSAPAVRALSLLAGAVTLPVLWRVGRVAGLGHRAWLVPALFLTSALAARYALTARPYALWLLALAVALLALVQALGTDDRAPPQRSALIFAAACLAGFYLHDATLIFLIAADIVLVLVRPARRRLIAWFAPQPLLLVAAAPQLLIILEQRGSTNIAWIPPPSAAGLIQDMIELLSGHEYPFGPGQGPALLLVLVVLFVVVPWRARHLLVPLGLLSALAVLMLAGAGILLPRTALWLLLPLALLLAAGLSGLRPAWLRRSAIGLALLIGGFNTAACLWTYEPEPWRGFLADFEAQRRPGDAVILLNGAPATGLRYYHAGVGAALYRWDATAIDGPGTAIRTLDDAVLPAAPIDADGIRGLLGQGRAVWLISRLRAQIPIEDALAGPFAMTVRQRQRSVEITRLSPPAP